jgi:hypothetical protein
MTGRLDQRLGRLDQRLGRLERAMSRARNRGAQECVRVSHARDRPGCDTGRYRYHGRFRRPQPSNPNPASIVVDPTDDNTDFSDAFCEFLQLSVGTVDGAELLLALHSAPETTWTARELVSKLQGAVTLSENEAAKYLEQFQQRGLIVPAPPGVRFQPALPEVEDHVRTLARLYNERPVTLIRVIYALRDTKIKTFADAFKIWRK